MKKQLLVFTTFAFFGCTQAQDLTQSQVPSVVINSFNSQFSKAIDVEWEMKGELYNVEFETGRDVDHEIWYDTAGEIVRSKEDVLQKELPKAVQKKISTSFKNYTLDDIKKITEGNEIMYKLELKSLTKQDWDVIIASNGTIQSKIAD